MWPFRRDKKLPRSFYEKGTELLRQAGETEDPDLRKVALEAAERYYRADVRKREPFFFTLLAFLLSYVVVIATAVWAFRSMAVYAAAAVVIGSYCFLALVVGATLRVGGYITESSLLGIIKAGFKTLILMRRQERSG